MVFISMSLKYLDMYDLIRVSIVNKNLSRDYRTHDLWEKFFKAPERIEYHYQTVVDIHNSFQNNCQICREYIDGDYIVFICSCQKIGFMYKKDPIYFRFHENCIEQYFIFKQENTQIPVYKCPKCKKLAFGCVFNLWS